jgi:hypothetical protein
VRPECFIQPSHGFYGFAQHEAGDRIDDPELYRKIDESLGRLDLAGIVAPADESLEAHHFARSNIDLRLKGATELGIADGKPQALLELHAGLPAPVH